MNYILLFLVAITTAPVSNTQCTGSLSNANSGYEVSWAVSGGNVDFTVSVDTTEWVGVGFSLTANMLNSDIVVGATDGLLSFVEDRWVANQRTLPTFDSQQNLENTEINIQDGRTTMSFRRALVTTDNNNQDLDLNQCVHLLRAWGGPVFSYNSPASFGNHGTNNRGVFSTQLCLQDCVDTISSSSTIVVPTRTSSSSIFTTSTSIVTPTPTQSPQCEGSLSSGVYEVSWAASGGNVDFTVSVDTTDWVGVGFSLSANMLNSDIVVGATDGMLSFVEDRWVANQRIRPTFDSQQNLEKTEINIQDGRTTMSFRRALATTDDNNQDLDLNQCVHLLRAWGGSVSNYNSPALFGFHSNQGVFSTQLCLQDCVDTISSSSTMVVPTRTSSSSIFTTSTSIVIPTPTQSPQCEGSLSSGDYEVKWSASGGKVDFSVSVANTASGVDTVAIGWVAVGFSLSASMPNSDIAVGGSNGKESFVEDRWASGYFRPPFDTRQDLENTEINLQDGRITMRFRRALVYDDIVPDSFISDTVQEDLNLNQCVYLLRAWGGSVSNYTSPAIFNIHNFQGVFDRQLCLQRCGDTNITTTRSSSTVVSTPSSSPTISTTRSSAMTTTRSSSTVDFTFPTRSSAMTTTRSSSTFVSTPTSSSSISTTTSIVTTTTRSSISSVISPSLSFEFFSSFSFEFSPSIEFTFSTSSSTTDTFTFTTRSSATTTTLSSSTVVSRPSSSPTISTTRSSATTTTRSSSTVVSTPSSSPTISTTISSATTTTRSSSIVVSTPSSSPTISTTRSSATTTTRSISTVVSTPSSSTISTTRSSATTTTRSSSTVVSTPSSSPTISTTISSATTTTRSSSIVVSTPSSSPTISTTRSSATATIRSSSTVVSTPSSSPTISTTRSSATTTTRSSSTVVSTPSSSPTISTTRSSATTTTRSSSTAVSTPSSSSTISTTRSSATTTTRSSISSSTPISPSFSFDFSPSISFDFEFTPSFSFSLETSSTSSTISTTRSSATTTTTRSSSTVVSTPSSSPTISTTISSATTTTRSSSIVVSTPSSSPTISTTRSSATTTTRSISTFVSTPTSSSSISTTTSVVTTTTRSSISSVISPSLSFEFFSSFSFEFSPSIEFTFSTSSSTTDTFTSTTRSSATTTTLSSSTVVSTPSSSPTISTTRSSATTTTRSSSTFVSTPSSSPTISTTRSSATTTTRSSSTVVSTPSSSPTISTTRSSATTTTRSSSTVVSTPSSSTISTTRSSATTTTRSSSISSFTPISPSFSFDFSPSISFDFEFTPSFSFSLETSSTSSTISTTRSSATTTTRSSSFVVSTPTLSTISTTRSSATTITRSSSTSSSTMIFSSFSFDMSFSDFEFTPSISFSLETSSTSSFTFSTTRSSSTTTTSSSSTTTASPTPSPLEILEFQEFDDTISPIVELPIGVDVSSRVFIGDAHRTIPGIGIGDELFTLAHVGDNGVISLNRPFLFWQPILFPSRNPFIQRSNVFAAYWADVDNRVEGTIRYQVFSDSKFSSTRELRRLDIISEYIRESQDTDFAGKWALLVEWNEVHPFNHLRFVNFPDQFDEETAAFLNSTNTFQAIIITDVFTTFVIYIYKCGELEWTGPPNGHAVVGYNIAGQEFVNEPFSATPDIISIACSNRPFSDFVNIVYDFEANPNIPELRCLSAYIQDIRIIGNPLPFSFFFPPPCPCTFLQAIRDRRFFFFLFDFPAICYAPIFSFHPNTMCCYSLFTFSLITSGSLASSTLAFNPFFQPFFYFNYDFLFRVTCCEQVDFCSLYHKRRPIENCFGYRPPFFTWWWGDPHIRTLDGRRYTFNGLGEYVLANINNTFETQARTKLAAENITATVFSAFVAADLTNGSNRVQVEIDPNEELLVRINGEDVTGILISVNDTYMNDSVMLERTAEDTILASFQSTITLEVSLREGTLSALLKIPEEFRGTVTGLLGNFDGDDTNDLIYRDGTIASDDIPDSEKHVLGQTWQITQEESLFFYDVGESVSTFSDSNHMPMFLDEILPDTLEDAIDVCGGDENLECLFDFTQTRNAELAQNTANTNNENNDDQEIIANFPPMIQGPDTFRITVDEISTYIVNVTDPDVNETFIVMIMADTGTLPDGYMFTGINSEYIFTVTITEVVNFTFSIVANDSLGASSTIQPQVEICGCENGGSCTTEGTTPSANPLILNCICPEAWEGQFCTDDVNGCTEVSCFNDSTCTDIPAPGVGAECPPCPTGYVGDGSKCSDIDECANITLNICEQRCINIPGDFMCDCYSGFELNDDGITCSDIDECTTNRHDCQHLCNNTEGSFLCYCHIGFILQPDGRTCEVDPDRMCPPNNMCEQLCSLETSDGSGVIPLDQMCFCLNGYTLDDNMKNCTDDDECLTPSTNPCNQICTNNDGGFECSCMSGFQLESQFTCEDFPDCLQIPSVCNPTQICRDTPPGSFTCSCPPGTSLNENGTCVIIDVVTTPPPPPPPLTTVERENSIVITLSNETTESFTPERQNAFIIITVEAINEYCLQNPDECDIIPNDDSSFTSKRNVHRTFSHFFKRQATMVEVVIYMTENTPNGLQITLFARRTGEGVFNAQAVLDAVEQAIDNGTYTEFIIFSVTLLFPPPTPSPIPFSPSPTPRDDDDGGLSAGQIAGIVIGVILGALLLIVLTTVLACCIWRCERSGLYSFVQKGPKTDEFVTIKNVSFRQTAASPEVSVRSMKLTFEDIESDEDEKEERYVKQPFDESQETNL